MTDFPLSNTQVSLYFKCGEQYRRRYIEREPSPPSASMLAGSAVHSAAEAYYRARLAGGDMDEAAVVEAARAAFTARLGRDGVHLSRAEVAAGVATTLDEARARAARLAGLFRREVGPTVTPEFVERRIEISVPGVRRKLVGIVDLATAPDTPGEAGDVVDLKTQAKSGSQRDADRSMQLTWYDVAYEALTGRRARRLVLHELVDTKVPKVNVIATERDDGDRAVLGEYIAAAERGIDAGHFPPAAPGAWWCNVDMCPYAGTCRYFPARAAGNGRGD